MAMTATTPTLDSATQLLDKKKYREACTAFQQLAHVNAHRAAANIGWGRALKSLGNYEEAADRFVAAFEAEPASKACLEALRQIRRGIDDEDQLIDRLQGVVDASSDSAVHTRWAAFLHDSGKFEKAVREYVKAAAVTSQSDPTFFEKWGEALAATGNHPEALEKFAVAIRSTSAGNDISRLLINVSKSIHVLGNPDSAIASFQSVLDTADRAARLQWAHELYVMERREQGAKQYERLVDEDPGDSLALASWAETLLEIDDRQAAADKLIRAVAMNPSLFTESYLAYQFLDKLKGTNGFIDRLTSVVAKAHDRAAHLMLASALISSGHAQEALRLFDMAATVNADEDEFLDYWIHVLIEAEQFTRAIKKCTDGIAARSPNASTYVRSAATALERLSQTNAPSAVSQSDQHRPPTAQVADALSGLWRALEQCDSEDAYLAWAEDVLPIDSRKRAIEDAQKLLKRLPDNGQVHRGLAKALARRESNGTAVVHYLEAIKILGTSSAVLLELETSLMAIEPARRGPAIALVQSVVDQLREPDTHLWWGMTLRRMDDIDAALAQFEAGLAIDAEHPKLLFASAEALAIKGRLRTAVDRLAAGIGACSGIFNTLSEASRVFSTVLGQLPRDEEAIRIIQRVIDGIDGCYAYRIWGFALGAIAHPSAELAHYRKALAKYPAWPELQAEYASRLASAGNFKEAMLEYETAMNRRPYSQFVHYAFAGTLLSARNYDEAIDAYSKLSEYDGDDASVFFDWGLTLSSLKMYDAAAEKYKKCLKLKNAVFAAYAAHNIASLDDRRGDYDSSAAHWVEALNFYRAAEATALDERRSEFFVYYASVLVDLERDFEGAEKKLNIAFELNPKSTFVLAAVCKLWMDRLEEISLDPKKASTVSLCYARALERRDAVAKLLNSKIDELPAAAFYVELGQLFLHTSEYDAARKALTKAIELDEKEQSAYYLLARAQIGAAENAPSRPADRRRVERTTTQRVSIKRYWRSLLHT